MTVRTYWSVAQCCWREERRAAHHVEKLGLDYYLPLTYVPDNAGDDERRTLLFPGFIFVKLRDGWQALCSGTVRGVRRLLMVPAELSGRVQAVSNLGAQAVPERVPAQVRGDEIRRLRGLEDECGVVRLRPRLRDGMPVVVESGGAYEGLEGLVEGMPAAGRVRVLFKKLLLGRVVSREFSESALRAA
jgi:hypothetical protein